jgi:hypothetical protein
MEYRNFDKCLAYIEELMIKDGPFDGLMGFSQVSQQQSSRSLLLQILQSTGDEPAVRLTAADCNL